VGIFLKNRVLGGLGYRQSCPGWAVGGDLLHVVGTSWRRWTWGWTDGLMMEVVGIAMCLVTGFFHFYRELSSVFRRKKTVNSNWWMVSFWLEMAISEFGPSSFNLF
jgi:hypothetical protein